MGGRIRTPSVILHIPILTKILIFISYNICHVGVNIVFENDTYKMVLRRNGIVEGSLDRNSR